MSAHTHKNRLLSFLHDDRICVYMCVAEAPIQAAKFVYRNYFPNLLDLWEKLDNSRKSTTMTTH